MDTPGSDAPPEKSVLSSRYMIGEELGRGAFGQVGVLPPVRERKLGWWAPAFPTLQGNGRADAARLSLQWYVFCELRTQPLPPAMNGFGARSCAFAPGIQGH